MSSAEVAPRRGAPDRVNVVIFWILLATAVLIVKLVVLAVDPQPQFFLGDSESYLY